MKNKAGKDLGRTRLASLIESDIRDRGLRAGDRYLTAQEVSRLLGVSTMTANRAMQDLARRDILRRNKKAGSFVGARFTSERPVSLQTVHLLMPAEYFATDKAIVDLVVAGIHAEMPEDAIQFTFVPASGEVAFVRNLVDGARRLGSLGGVVLFLSSPAVQRFFKEAGVPAVVAGSVYAEVGGLPWFDLDQKEIGRLLARAAIQRGHRRIAILMRDRWGAGDNLMIDGVHEELGSARIESLNVRSLPSDPAVIAASIRAMLESDPRPTALICRSRLAADAAADAVRALGKSVPKDVAIFLADHYPNDRRPVTYLHTVSSITPEEHGATIARLLQAKARGQAAEPVSRAPVVLRDPEKA